MTVNLERSGSIENLQVDLHENPTETTHPSLILFKTAVNNCMEKIGFIINLLGSEHRNPPFRKWKKRIKKHCKLGVYSPTELKIGNLNSTNSDLSDSYSRFTSITELMRDSEETRHERMFNEQNSLFLNRDDLSKKQKRDILRNADRIEDLCNIDPERFEKKSSRGSVLDKKLNIIYKFKRNTESESNLRRSKCGNYLEDFAYLSIRGNMHYSKIKNIILPKRELWTKKDGDKISEIIIEEYIPGLENYNSAYYEYDSRPELFKDAIVELAELSNSIDLSKCALSKQDFNIIHRAKLNYVNFYNLFQSSQTHGKKINYRFPGVEKKSVDGEDLTVMKQSIDTSKMAFCDFRKLPVKFCQEDGIYKFVLINTDLCISSTLSTSSSLSRMFPKHSELIFELIYGYPFDESSQRAFKANDTPLSFSTKTKTREEIIEKYKKEKAIIRSKKMFQLRKLTLSTKIIRRLVDDFKGIKPYVKYRKIKLICGVIKKHFSHSVPLARHNRILASPTMPEDEINRNDNTPAVVESNAPENEANINVQNSNEPSSSNGSEQSDNPISKIYDDLLSKFENNEDKEIDYRACLSSKAPSFISIDSLSSFNEEKCNSHCIRYLYENDSSDEDN